MVDHMVHFGVSATALPTYSVPGTEGLKREAWKFKGFPELL